MSPAGSKTSSRNSKITRQLEAWSERDGKGEAFDSSGGFELPNGAVRSPDAAWVELSRLKELAGGEDDERFLPLCPTFVIELRSPTDTLPSAQEKMREYLANGARLGWLIDPHKRQVYVFRPDADVEVLDKPRSVAGDPELPGFVLNLGRIWNLGW